MSQSYRFCATGKLATGFPTEKGGWREGRRYLHGHETVVNENFFREEVSADGGLITGTELFVDLAEAGMLMRVLVSGRVCVRHHNA